MTPYILLGVTVLFSGLRGVFSKLAGKTVTEKSNLTTLNFFTFLAAWLLITLFGWRQFFPLDGLFLLMAAVYALLTLLSQLLFLKATACGHVALCTLFYSCGFLVPTLLGALLYHETICVLQWTGIAVLLVSFALGAEKSPKKGDSLGWMGYSLLAMLASGGVGLLQKIFRMSTYSGRMNGFLSVAFLMIVLTLAVMMPKKEQPPRRMIRSGGAVGICFGCTNMINLYLSGLLPAVICFPVLNGGTIIGTAVLSRVILKEHLSPLRICSLALGTAGILLIALGK